MAWVWLDFECQSTTPGQYQAGYVAQVVPCVRQQRQRVDAPAVIAFDGNKDGIQRDADGKSAVEVGRRVVVMEVVIVGHAAATCTRQS